MIKVFISQPMRGLSDEEILEKRRKAIDDVYKRLGKDVMIISSIFGDSVVKYDNNAGLRYLARSIDSMVDADYVYFCNGFELARGCLIEHMCAVRYGKEIMYEFDEDEGADDGECSLESWLTAPKPYVVNRDCETCMDEPVLKVKLDEGAFVPERAHDTDGGIDIRTNQFGRVPANGGLVFTTGVHVEIPHGYSGLLVSKSGLNVNKGLTSTGLIDEGFTGEIKVKLYNHTNEDYLVAQGDKITQLVLIPVSYARVEVVNEIDGGERGDNGYGSTGR